MANRFTVAVALLGLALSLTGCGLLSEDAQEGIAIQPTSAQPTVDLGLGPGVRPLSFGPGDKGSPRVNPSGDRVAFILDGYVTEKPLYTQDSHRRTAMDFGALSAEWLLDGSLAILTPETENYSAKARPALNSLYAAQPDGSSSEGSSNIRKLTEEKVETAGAVPGGQAIVAAVTTSPTPEAPDEPPRSRLVLLWGSEELAKIFLGGRVEGHVTGLSVSPNSRQVALAIQHDAIEDQKASRFEIQVYRSSRGTPHLVARVPEGMEVLGAPQWTPHGVYFVAAEDDAPAGAARGGTPTPYVLYRVSDDWGTPEAVSSIGEGFVPISIRVSPDGGRLAVVGRRNPGSPTNLYVLDLTSETLEAATTNENMEIKTNPRDLAWSPDGRSVILVARSALSGPKVYDAPANTLSSAFYNLYEVPVGDLSNRGSEG